ncbi:SDR family oxidoreductase, partial [Mycobacterium intracellulare]|uniref:SDR family oxidoreductase n=1 Tax=Mycobacterium intracellulare TaxID=1767 RepID=UPI001916B8C2
VVEIIESRGGTAVSDFSDVGDEEQVDLAVERAYSQLGRLDIVVNNAGIVRDKAIWNMTADDFDLVMRVHVRGSW